MDKKGPTDVDAYIAAAPRQVQPILRTVRKTLRAAVPEAEEVISYQMPAYRFHGMVVYFAAFSNHYSLFASSVGARERFKDQLKGYVQAKGTIRFPLDEPVPVKLIAGIAKHVAKENLERSRAKEAAAKPKKAVASKKK